MGIQVDVDKWVREALEAKRKEAQALASRILDPKTGRPEKVSVRLVGEELVFKIEGSERDRAELQRRLGHEETRTSATVEPRPRLYLAHATEDKQELALRLAEHLISAGIEVWLDTWEIRTGDSLRQKMEEGLADCTHFAVLLTPVSMAALAKKLELPVATIEDGVLELEDNGGIERSRTVGSDVFFPTIALFADFDRYFLDYDNAQDAVGIASWAVGAERDQVAVDELPEPFSAWEAARLNSARNFLEVHDAVDPVHVAGGEHNYPTFFLSARTRRFVRAHG